MVDVSSRACRRIPASWRRRLLAPCLAAGLAAGLALALPAPVLAAPDRLEAVLSQPEVRLGESVELLLRQRPHAGAGVGRVTAMPDLSPLEGDFQILDRRQVQRSSTVNGRTDSSLDWIVTLAPRRAGALEIPALALGGARTEPLRLLVAERAASAAGSAAAPPPIMLEVEVDRADPYVQGQVVLTARILDRVGMTAASLTDPVVPGAVVERLGEDVSRSERRDGRDWRVIERRYAIFPQASGPLEIAPLHLEARLPADPRAAGGVRGQGFRGPAFGGGMFPDSLFSGTGPFDQIFAQMRSQAFGGGFADPFLGRGGQRTSLVSEPVTLQVRERPAAAGSGWWLPARDLRLEEEWSGDSFRVGEPVTRRITLLARGATAAQLPELALPPADGLRQYVEDSASQDAVRGGDAVAARQVLVSVVPGRPGELVLPELRVPWWDIEAEQERVAVLPARVLQVAPAAGGTAASQAVAPATVGQAGAEPAGEPAVAGIQETFGEGGFPARVWPAALALALLAAAGGGLHWWRRRRATSGRAGAAGGVADRAAGAVVQACVAGDGAAALAALAAWGRLCWPANAPRGAAAVAERLDDADLRRAVRDLNALLYGGGREDEAVAEACRRLGEAFRRARHRRGERVAVSALPPLYPEAGPAATR